MLYRIGPTRALGKQHITNTGGDNNRLKLKMCILRAAPSSYLLDGCSFEVRQCSFVAESR